VDREPDGIAANGKKCAEGGNDRGNRGDIPIMGQEQEIAVVDGLTTRVRHDRG
jgi:hypothetical protein